MARQLSAFVTIKRLNHMANHYNAAIGFLYPPKDNQTPPAEPNLEAAQAAERAAYEFLEVFFKLATANAVDLTTAGAVNAFEYETALEQQNANPQA